MSVISLMDFSASKLTEKDVKKISELSAAKSSSSVSWINIDSVKNKKVVEEVCEYFLLHPLIYNDILTVRQSPKIEFFKDYVYLSLKMAYFAKDEESVAIEQVSFVLGRNFVLSFQENPRDVFNEIRDKIRADDTKIRKSGADYLFYKLIDAIVDNYFSVLEKIDTKVNSLEGSLMRKASQNTLREIHKTKRQILLLLKAIWPMRNAISRLEKEETRLITKPTVTYVRDVYEHVIHAVESIETFRDILSGLMELYVSSISNKTNEVMKVLTIIATIFIPLTFITGIYGMNFDFMPELRWRYGYFLILGFMMLIAVLMLYFFRKKKWF